ncbi:sulfite exporter TauE/SafE family protein [Glycomyces sp. L485]|uniref:sulfite exporter TauE/SafE family protein n=1 Tax=Glycomyces sp. L485 TaxID=2909235 RepID=UPI001F4B569D|nr:sulfite exporter TauE/SafE family protein [Glycomyces sp. L485]MCH7232125.1 sulfite exporter TauE/SafE family protein [Glycomyces sp. L485]
MAMISSLAGFVAQLVNGSLGMGYGTITMTFLLGLGIAPAVASASVNVATAASDLVSGFSHWRLGNVHWPTVLKLGIPGAVGGFAGAWALASLTSLDAATPVTSTILIGLGVIIVWRFAKGRKSHHSEKARTGFAAPTGLVAGFLNAVGGGGWGPVTMPVMLTTSRLAPHKVVGSVSAAEFAAATAAVVGFWLALPNGLTVLWPLVVGMAVGGMIAAPAAAWLTRKIPTLKLGTTIGMLVIALNLKTFLGNFSVPWQVVAFTYLALAAVWVAALVGRRTTPEPAKAEA